MPNNIRFQFGPSNEPNTCLWCGRKVRPISTALGLRRDLERIRHLYSIGESQRREMDRAKRHHEEFKDKYYREGRFCRNRCAIAFALAAARNGYRFEPQTVAVITGGDHD